jgi:hypothetical protein
LSLLLKPWGGLYGFLLGLPPFDAFLIIVSMGIIYIYVNKEQKEKNNAAFKEITKRGFLFKIFLFGWKTSKDSNQLE